MGRKQYPDTPLAMVLRIVGTQTRLAEIAGKSQGTVCQRLLQGKPIWPESIPAIEAATGISRHVLNPDVHPLPTPADAPCPTVRDSDYTSLAPTRPAVPCDQAAASHPHDAA